MEKKQIQLTPAALSALAKGDIDNAVIAATPGGIEAQEKAGQALLVASTNMPKLMYPDRQAFEKMGFEFGEAVNEVFLTAKLPLGWTRRATAHSMYSEIIDEQGRVRVIVFYKARFYDVRANATLLPRYRHHRIYPNAQGSAPVILGVSDAGVMIYKAGESPKPYNQLVEHKLRAAIDYWLKEHFPNWADPTAYW